MTLSWSPSTSSAVAGYRVRYGDTSGSYTDSLDVGNKTTATISSLKDGTTYYFVITAYDSSGLSSVPSNEVSFSTAGTQSTTTSSATPVPNATPAPSPTSTPSSSATPNPFASPAPSPAGTPEASPGATPTPTPTPAQGRIGNLSARVRVGLNNNAVISGFIIGGTGQKTVILRALGPSLAAAGVRGAMADPTLDLIDAKGALVATCDNWREKQQALFAQGGRYHAFQPGSDSEAAIAVTLPPGAYTTVIRGKNGTTGVALAELYDYSGEVGSKLVNISARALVQTGDDVMIGGLVIAGDVGNNIVLRALGPSLRPYGINNALPNPTLELHNSDGAIIGFNDDWKDNSAQASKIAVSGIAPTDLLESAMAVTLTPGSYTAIVRGRYDGIGVALFEVYDIN